MSNSSSDDVLLRFFENVLNDNRVFIAWCKRKRDLGCSKWLTFPLMSTVLIEARLVSLSTAIGRFLKNAWDKQPVILVSCGIGLAGQFTQPKKCISCGGHDSRKTLIQRCKLFAVTFWNSLSVCSAIFALHL